MRRRSFLAACAAVGATGCLGNGSGTDGDAGGGTATSESAADPTASPTETPTGTPTPTETPAPTETRTSATTTTASASATPTGTPVFPGYDTAEVRVRTPDGEQLGAVTAAIADTGDLRYTGLSDTESLPEDRGMLFVYEEVGDHTYVMREMDFGIDIVYADDEGVITRIHHAPAPGPDENGENQTYPGRGQYVLEVNKGWTTERGVEEGDELRFEL
ncbi:DUF192 domain-containing protein [Halosimplex sp. J119]